MELKVIRNGFKDIKQLYTIYEEAFPKEERIPTDDFLNVVREYGCTPWAIYNTDCLVGFVCAMHSTEWKLAYIWFLAIAADKRSHGYGGRALEKLKEIYAGSQLILDMEPIDPQAGNYEQRLRRLKFYERNGFSRALVGASYFGMNFELMCTAAPLRLEDFKAMLLPAAEKGFRPTFYPIENK